MTQTEWEYLCGVPQEPEADIIVGLLESQGIPVNKLYPEAGQFLKAAYGLTCGVDIYVPKEYLAESKELLEKTFPDIEKEFPETTSLSPETPLTVTKTFSSLVQWIIILIVIVLVLVLLAYNEHFLFFIS